MATDEKAAERPATPRRRKRQMFAPVPTAKPVQEINGHDLAAAENVRPDGFTDDDVALQFTGTFSPALRFVATWNKWMIWDGAIWRRDDTLRVFDLVRRCCRVIGAQATEPRIRSALASARTVAAIEKLVRSDRAHACSADIWDGNPLLLNTPGGVVDLTTGETGPHKPEFHMTKTAAVAPGGDCPIWLSFLDRVTGNNLLLRDYLKRVAGYCLTGATSEQAMFFAYGTGRNGKGTFINTLADVMGDYAVNAGSETFTEAGAGQHLTVLARLQGARMVRSQETEEGVPWAEARIKAVTGGDPITANFMRQDPFTYMPQFKLLVSGNHKPGLKSVDEAIRARFNLIPFTIFIPPTDRDPQLSNKLKAEWPGILAWAIEGCLDWQAVRLRPPAVVSEATEDYFDSEDATRLWIADCCDVRGSEKASLLFNSWIKWALAAGEKPGSIKAFTRTMEKHGYKTGKRTAAGVPIVGVQLKPRVERPFLEPEADRDWP